jgi:regulator of sigma E protease
MDKSTGAGKIGVYFWTDPVIGSVTPGSPADAAGLKPGDRIESINGIAVPHTAELSKIMADQPADLSIDYTRNGTKHHTDIKPVYTDTAEDSIGVYFKTLTYRTPRLSFFGAVAKGVTEAWDTLAVSVQSLSLLFKGIDLTQAVSGPVRITYMMGDAATAGFTESVRDGFESLAAFLALISIALGMMNLLPLPVLDGGMILLFLIEMLIRRPIPPKAIMAFQTAGVVIIFGLMAFAIFGDVLFLVRQ